MKRILFVLAMLSSTTFATEEIPSPWLPLPGYTLWDLYTRGSIDQDDLKRETNLISGGTASWPDGRQALITYIEVRQGKKKRLYKCIDYTNKDFQSTGQFCYELREPQKKK